MSGYMILSIIGSVVAVVMAIVILLGRGDCLISGYNTASKETRAKYNISRLRLLTSVTLLLVVLILWITYILDISENICSTLILAVALTDVLLQYTWAKH